MACAKAPGQRRASVFQEGQPVGLKGRGGHKGSDSICLIASRKFTPVLTPADEKFPGADWGGKKQVVRGCKGTLGVMGPSYILIVVVVLRV